MNTYLLAHMSAWYLQVNEGRDIGEVIVGFMGVFGAWKSDEDVLVHVGETRLEVRKRREKIRGALLEVEDVCVSGRDIGAKASLFHMIRKEMKKCVVDLRLDIFNGRGRSVEGMFEVPSEWVEWRRDIHAIWQCYQKGRRVGSVLE